jgi:hypothetical protein
MNIAFIRLDKTEEKRDFMKSGDYLTIRDYFDQVLVGVGRHARRQASPPDTSNTDTHLNFRKILKTQQMSPSENTCPKTTGLTIADYLANPIRVKCQYNHHLTAISLEKKYKPADKTSPNKYLSSIKSSAAKRSEAPLLSNTSQPMRPSPVSTSTRKLAEANQRSRIEKSIHDASRKYNLPPNLIRAVIKAESNFQVNATSHAGAQGLMQLMPLTAKELGVIDPFDIEQNIDGGSRYLRQMLDNFEGDIKLALAAYNAGPGTVRRYGGDVPFAETKQYVDRVLRFSGQTA